jgi:hypothetical protein
MSSKGVWQGWRWELTMTLSLGGEGEVPNRLIPWVGLGSGLGLRRDETGLIDGWDGWGRGVGPDSGKPGGSLRRCQRVEGGEDGAGVPGAYQVSR